MAESLSLKGDCVLTPVFFAGDANNLKGAHFKRIELSDAIYVVNKDQYIGNSTKKEIEYAKSLNKKIIYMK